MYLSYIKSYYIWFPPNCPSTIGENNKVYSALLVSQYLKATLEIKQLKKTNRIQLSTFLLFKHHCFIFDIFQVKIKIS